MAATPRPQFEDNAIKELKSEIEDVSHEVREINDRFAKLGAIRNRLSAIHETAKAEMKKMREESEAVEKRIMMKIEKIHDYLTDKSGDERTRPSMFEWNVKNFSRLKDHMLKGKAKPFFSEKFYVGINGYKMYLGAHFAAKNETGKDSLSIYTYITKGPFDQALQWPYSRRSTFIIVDQMNNLHHKVAEIVPEKYGRDQEHCFQKPGSGPNEGAGFTAMMPVEELEDPEKGYLVNDSFLVHFITSDE